MRAFSICINIFKHLHHILGFRSIKLEFIKYDIRPLSDLTKGIHIHKIGATDKKVFDMAVKALKEKGIALR